MGSSPKFKFSREVEANWTEYSVRPKLAFLGLPVPRRYVPFGIIVLRATDKNGSQLLCFEWNLLPPKNFLGSVTFVTTLFANKMQGFAAVENVLYADGAQDLWLIAQRGFTATLLHACCSATVGFGLARAKLAARGALAAASWVLGSVLVAVVVHGLYDLFLLHSDRALAVASLLLVLPAALALLAWKVRWSRSRSRHYHPTASRPNP